MKIIFAKNKGFTLIELLVSTAIIVIITTTAFLSLGQGKDSVQVSSGADEVSALFEELKSYAVAPERSEATDYILVISRSDSPKNVCSKGLNAGNNKLTKKNQFMICVSVDSNIASANLNDAFSRVRGGSFENVFDIADSFAPTADSLVYNARVYDGALGANKTYYDTGLCGSDTCNRDELSRSLVVSKGSFSKKINLNFLVNTIKPE